MLNEFENGIQDAKIRKEIYIPGLANDPYWAYSPTTF